MSGRRASALSPPEFFLLEEWGKTLRHSFGKPPYLVGSCERGVDFRDVDVVLMLPDDEYAVLMGPEPRRIVALNVAISVWGQRATGLPIDFRFQDTTTANAEYGDQTRNPLGVRDGWEFTGQRPTSKTVGGRP